jgi:cytochrome oxidase Cu insertion factor (SCO1/SenC/PrrC family)
MSARPAAGGRAVAALRLVAGALLCWLGGTAHAAADPTPAHAPQMQFVPPAPGTYQLQRIQRAPDAVLVDARYQQRRLANLTRDKVTLLTFFYTYCTDAWGCPFARQLMGGLREQLLARPQAAGRVRFVSISFDPTHDTPEVLRLHAGQVPADSRLPWEFLTARGMGELLPLLDDLGQDVRVEYDDGGRPTRTINHMLKLFLIDRDGVVREIYALDYLHPATMLNDIETLLAEERRALRPGLATTQRRRRAVPGAGSCRYWISAAARRGTRRCAAPCSRSGAACSARAPRPRSGPGPCAAPPP